MKHRYTAIHDTPMLVRAKKAYLQSSDVSKTAPNFPRSFQHHVIKAHKNTSRLTLYLASTATLQGDL